MPGLKRSAAKEKEGKGVRPKETHKRQRKDDEKSGAAGAPAPASFITSSSTATEVNFPRGGGTSLTPFEHKQALREVSAETRRHKEQRATARDADDDLFKTQKAVDVQERQRARREKKNAEKKKRDGKPATASAGKGKKAENGKDDDALPRIEVLNYKRLKVGTRLLCTILAIHPLALVVSLPDQLLGHIPITSVSELFTQRLEQAADDDDESDDEDDASSSTSSGNRRASALTSSSEMPDLRELFVVGQWVQASVTEVHSAAGAQNRHRGREGGEYEQESQRVELSLDPSVVNEGVQASDLSKGFLLPMTVKSKEDNGYLMSTGISEDSVQGFVSFKDCDAGVELSPGQVVLSSVLSVSENGRSVAATVSKKASALASLTEQAPSATALVPGNLVNALVVSTSDEGLNVKLFGMFDATISSSHFDTAQTYSVGQRVKARILWDEGQTLSTEEDVRAADSTKQHKIALATTRSILSLSPRSGLVQTYPVGAFVKATVLSTIEDWGVISRIQDSQTRAFTHISNCSDDHITSLPATSGKFRIGSTHDARVIGHSLTDDLVRVSFEKSVLQKSFMRVSEVKAGQTIKCTIRSITPQAILLDINGSVDGVVFPAHFADIPLKKPEKKYKVGQSVTARVLKVEPDRNRVAMTLKRTLVQSELPIVASMDESRVGVVTHGVVARIVEGNVGPTGVLVDLFGNVRVYVPIVEALEASVSSGTGSSSSSLPSAEVIRSSFFIGKCVKVRLTRVDQATGRIMASIRQAGESYLKRLNVDAVAIGEQVTGKLAAVHQDVVVLELQPSSVRALLGLATLAKERKTSVEELRASLTEGEIITDLRVIDKKSDRGIVIVGGAQSVPRQSSSLLTAAADLKAGCIASARLGRRDGSNAVMLHIGNTVRCRLHVTDCSDDYNGSDAQALLPTQEGSAVRVHLLNVRGTTNKKADVSIRPSRLDNSAAEEVKDREIANISDISVGDRLSGFVKSKVEKAGLFVDLGRSITARVKIAELFDSYVSEWTSQFEAGQLVSGTVTEVDKSSNKVEFSLRSVPGGAKNGSKQNANNGKAAAGLTIDSIEQGDKVKCSVRAIAEFGVFVQIEGSNVSGLAHKTQLSDDADPQAALKAFNVGDKVKAVVLKVDKTKGKISFGLKPSLFDEQDFVDSDDDDEVQGESDDEEDIDDMDADSDDIEMDAEALLENDDDSDEDSLLQVDFGSGDDDEDEEDDDDEDDDEGEDEDEDSDVDMSDSPATGEDEEDDDDFINVLDDLNEKQTLRKAGQATKSAEASIEPALRLTSGLLWSGSGQADAQDSGSDSSDNDSDDEADNERQKKRRNKKQIQEDLTADLATKMPESEQDFERLLLGSPNSSFIWIQFMSFQVQLGEVEKARQLAQRALQVIHFREEGEKLNIWLALLNLENTYGNEESLERTFKEACAYNDAKVIHMRLAEILEQSGKIEQAQEHWKRTAKKFGFSAKVWIEYHRFLLRHGDGGGAADGKDDARSVVARSMQSLEKRKHVKTIVAYALDEFKIGDAERGRTIFEGLVDSYPKRLDIWWQYVDQETKLRNVAQVRELFKRILTLKQSSKKVKSTLKKWLEFEKNHGDQAGQQSVLERARQFVEERSKANDDDEQDKDDSEDDADEQE